MIGWQNPAAFWALALLAAPIVIHLLRRHRADRVLFPSLRFVSTAQTSASRFRRLSDRWLLVLRIAVLALSVAALARPVFVTDRRVIVWNASTARALIVDTSASMKADDRADRAGRAADEEARAATYSRRFDAPSLTEGLSRATGWLGGTPPSRKEIVVISDVQRGAVDPAAISRVPGTIGLRFVAVGSSASERRFEGPALLGLRAGASRAQLVDLTEQTTAVTVERRQGIPRAGIRILPETGAESLLRVVARAGAFDGSVEQPIALRFAGADSSSNALPVTPVRAGWMLRTVLRLQDALSSTGGPSMSVLEARPSPPWIPVLGHHADKPVVAAAASGAELVVDVAAPVDSLLAAEITRAVLNARVNAVDDYEEYEIVRADAAAVNGWTRPAAAVASDAWRRADITDARWCWFLALVLLGAEQWLRRRSIDRPQAETTRAAA